MAGKPFISDKLADQIIVIRNSGAVNMFDVPRVQSEAHRRGFNDLVLLLSRHRREYVDYILQARDKYRCGEVILDGLRKRLFFVARICGKEAGRVV